MVGTLGPNTNKGLRFWTAEPSVVLTYTDLSHIFRPVFRSLPDQPAQQPALFWTCNLLQSTLAPAPTPTVFRGPLRSLPDQPPQLLQWQQPYNVVIYQPAGLPPGENVSDLTPRPYDYHVQLRSWGWSYNLNLIGQDRLPVGEQIYDLAPGQRPPEQIQLHSWIWSYNLNLIGKDRLPAGKISVDLTPRAYEHHVQLRAWAWSYNLNLTGQDRLPFRQTDWPLPQPVQWYKEWQWSYNLNLIGQDQFPVRQQDWPIAPTPLWSREWVQNLLETTLSIQRPFAQTYWPIPLGPAPITPSWAWSYNLNLIGQDKLPTGAIVTERPQLLAPALFQTWINAVNLALVTVPPLPRPPFNQFDWPLTPAPQQPAQSWTAAYNKNLVGQDQLPIRQQDWQNPIPVQWYRDWSINLLQSTLIVARLPFNQFDWPVAVAPPRLDQSFAASYNKNLIGQDRLPAGAIFTERPQLGPAQPDRGFTASYNRNLIGQDRLPNRQQDWPLTPAATAAVIQTWIQAVNLALLHQPPVVGPLGILFNQYAWPLPDRGPVQPDRGFGFFNPNYYPPTPPPPVTGLPHNLHFHATLGRLKSF
jgi:hypothetical protein